MKMKKIILLLALALAVGLTGCKAKEAVAVDAAAVTLALTEGVTFSDALYKLEGEEAFDFYELDKALLASYTVYIGTGATCEELAVFEVAEAKDLETVKTAVDKRIATQKEAYGDYLPEEAAKLETAVVESKGKVLVFVVANDNAIAAEVVSKALDGK